MSTITDIMSKVDASALLARSLSSWRPILADEVQVYVFGENYIAKRFDAINYKFCEKKEAQEILIDNLYALLRFKYFKSVNEEIDERIDEIVKSFTANLKTTLKKVSFDKDSDSNVVSMLPDSCIAFRNGVFDFRKNDWLFKYDIHELKNLSNKIYLYDPSWVILWYLDYNFDPLDINICTLKLNDFIDIMKSITIQNGCKNYCFELMYNIAHDEEDRFSYERFLHLCEIMGYTLLQSFSQHFVMLIGSGQNGKNSLFDGCLTHKVVPRPAANDLDSIENDRFITGSLENKAQNIFLETSTSAKTYSESKMIKALTGSMYQTIEQKGISKYSGLINCKYIFSANDQDKVKFSDNTIGFRRRINMFEIWYHWDAAKRYMKNGDYFDTTFSDSLIELKNDLSNTTAFVYFAMYGILNGTKNFTKNFQFSQNDWNYTYADIDTELKEKIGRISSKSVATYLRKETEEVKTFFFDTEKTRLYNSKSMKDLGYTSYEDMVEMFFDDEKLINYFSENDVYMSVRFIQLLCKDFSSPATFSSSLKKIYMLPKFENIHNNKSYVKVSFLNKKLKIIQ